MYGKQVYNLKYLSFNKLALGVAKECRCFYVKNVLVMKKKT